jgi:unsaturated rhamnogalacturonyl hydrolase
MALTDAAGYLPEGGHRNTLTVILSELLTNLWKYADPETGMYYQVTDQGSRAGNYLESSGSSMVALAMMKAARLGFVDESFNSFGMTTFKGVCGKYLRETDGTSGRFTLGGICLSAGLGPADNTRRDGSFEYYISEPVVENDAKGIAPFLMCYAETVTLRNNF